MKNEQGVRVVQVAGRDAEVRNLDVMVDETIGTDSERVALWGHWAAFYPGGEHLMMRILSGRLKPYQGELTIQTTANTTVEVSMG